MEILSITHSVEISEIYVKSFLVTTDTLVILILSYFSFVKICKFDSINVSSGKNSKFSHCDKYFVKSTFLIHLTVCEFEAFTLAVCKFSWKVP